MTRTRVKERAEELTTVVDDTITVQIANQVFGRFLDLFKQIQQRGFNGFGCGGWFFAHGIFLLLRLGFGFSSRRNRILRCSK